MSIIVAVDVGGTFTDLVGVDETTGKVFTSKVASSPRRIAESVIECIEKSGLSLSNIRVIVHGSTVAINTAIEGRGAKTALLTTKGFRDAYIIGRGNRLEVFNVFFKKPRPLVPRHFIFEINERILADGTIQTPIDYVDMEHTVKEIKDNEVESVAICFLHSYANPTHEQLAFEHLKDSTKCYVCKSSDIITKYGEYERISTTVMNAYIGPTVATYVKELDEVLHSEGFNGHLFIMQSTGGMMSPLAVVEKPVAILESGPVGGIIAAAETGSYHGLKNLIALDVGGTTAKTSVISGGLPRVIEGYYVGGYAGGQYVMYPVVDIVEVGAGGGSIAWIDSVGSLKIGPRSAGAVPGPVCYDKGGLEPTVTDANLLLGRLGQRDFLGGEMVLNLEKAYDIMEDKIADKLGLSVEEAAHAILRIATSNISLAVRQVTIERGLDPRDFVLCAFGGAGPLHAVAVARDLHIKKVLIPVYPAHFSALGMILADHRRDLIRTFYHCLNEVDFDEMLKIIESMMAQTEETIMGESVEEIELRHKVFLDMRYVGQEFTLKVPITLDDVKNKNISEIMKKFHETYVESYGYSFSDEAVETVNIHLVTIGVKKNKPAVSVVGKGFDSQPQPVEHRKVWLEKLKPVDCPVYQRELIDKGSTIIGPAIIKEYASTTILWECDVCTVLERGELLVTVGDAA